MENNKKYGVCPHCGNEEFHQEVKTDKGVEWNGSEWAYVSDSGECDPVSDIICNNCGAEMEEEDPMNWDDYDYPEEGDDEDEM